MKSAEMIGWAIGGLEREIVATRQRLSELTAQANTLRSKLPGRLPRTETVAGLESLGSAPAAPKRKRRKMSREARKRISDMMKKRWAERRKATK